MYIYIIEFLQIYTNELLDTAIEGANPAFSLMVIQKQKQINY